VHASPALVRASKRQDRSFTVFTFWSKIGGLSAGTPPIGGLGPSSHTKALPFPSARDTAMRKFGS